jgi:hypothetical protein
VRAVVAHELAENRAQVLYGRRIGVKRSMARDVGSGVVGGVPTLIPGSGLSRQLVPKEWFDHAALWTCADGRVPNWRVIIDGQPAVLKREWYGDESDVAWEHAFLARLTINGAFRCHDRLAAAGWCTAARSGPSELPARPHSRLVTAAVAGRGWRIHRPL